MSKKMLGTLVGIGFSLGAVVLWVIIALIGYLAGIAGALMGILFIIGYRKFSEEQKVSGYVITAASIVIVVEVVIAELITIAILAAQENVTFGLALSIREIQSIIIRDVLIGLALSFLVFIGYVVSIRKKNSLDAVRVEDNSQTNNSQSINVVEEHVQELAANDTDLAQENKFNEPIENEEQEIFDGDIEN